MTKEILVTVKDYQEIFNKLVELGYGAKEVLFGYDSDFAWTGDYLPEDIIYDEGKICFTEVGTIKNNGKEVFPK